MALHQEVW